MKDKILIKNRNHLMKVIYDEMQENGNECDLNHLDISNITSLEKLFFFNNEFNGNISQWNVSHITNMNEMFKNSKFNGDILSWNVSKVEKMSYMFECSSFKGDLSDWKTYSSTDPGSAFKASRVPIPYWARLENLDMRAEAIDFYHFKKLIAKEIELNGNQCDLNHIDISKVKKLTELFKDSDFNGDISKWDVSHITSMKNMFSGSKFKGNLNDWTPYNLRTTENIFLESNVQPPYWSEYNDKEDRKKAIDKYLLSKELGNELNMHGDNKKKIKI